MALFAISDVHLSFGVENKAMDVFGRSWENHTARLEAGWRKVVGPGDVVLLPGDISWAMSLKDAKEDLWFLHRLPGIKVLLRGNHDYWWSGYSKVLSILPPSLYALQNNVLHIQDYHIAGSRGWLTPGNGPFCEEKDRKLLEREKIRLQLSLSQLKEGQKNICILHYPPFNEKGQPSDFVSIIDQYPVDKVLYGHLHGSSGKCAFQGRYNAAEYFFVSADALGFVPVRIMD